MVTPVFAVPLFRAFSGANSWPFLLSALLTTIVNEQNTELDEDVRSQISRSPGLKSIKISQTVLKHWNTRELKKLVFTDQLSD